MLVRTEDAAPDGDASTTEGLVPWLTLFEDRYGVGSHQRLMALLAQPCVTFANIASRFSVTVTIDI